MSELGGRYDEDDDHQVDVELEFQNEEKLEKPFSLSLNFSIGFIITLSFMFFYRRHIKLSSLNSWQ